MGMKAGTQLRRKIGWLDSAGMPSHTHLTDDGVDTICGEHDEYIAGRQLVMTPKRTQGRSNFCRRCFKEGGKSLSWDKRCVADHTGVK